MIKAEKPVGQDQDSPNTKIETFLVDLKVLLVFMILIIFPLDIVQRIDSLLLAFDFWDWIGNASGMILLIAALATTFAVLVSFLGVIPGRWHLALRSTVLVLLLVWASYVLVRTVKAWLIKTLELKFLLETAVEIKILVFLVCSLLLVIFWWRTRVNLLDRFGNFARPLFPLTLGLCLFSAVVVGGRLLTHDAPKSPVCAEDYTSPMDPAKGPTHADDRPNVILVTFDSLTSLDVSLYGYEQPTSPNIDRLAKEAHAFKRAYANANWTRPGTVSILTGKLPSTHKAISYSSDAIRLNDEMQTLPWLLRERGYTTHAVVSNLTWAHPLSTGLARSFDSCTWDTVDEKITRVINPFSLVTTQLKGLRTYGFSIDNWFAEFISVLPYLFRDFLGKYGFAPLQTGQEFPAEIPFENAMDLVKRIRSEGNGRPYFLWIHVWPPHSPYLPPSPFLGEFLPGEAFAKRRDQQGIVSSYYNKNKQPKIDQVRLRYDENIRYTDSVFGSFVEKMRALGELDKSILVVTSDHGESFEDGYVGHGSPLLYRQFIDIPLLIRIPGQKQGSLVETNAQQVDIAPTVLESINLPVPDWMEGDSLFPALNGAAPRGDKPKISAFISQSSRFGALDRGTLAVIRGRFKLIWTLGKNRFELYDLDNDPGEDQDLSAKHPDKVEALKDILQERVVSRY